MSNSVYDSSFITRRRQNRAISASFNNRLYPPGQQSGAINTTSYGPLAGTYDNSIMNSVKEGKMAEYRNNCIINDGCPCNIPSNIQPPIPPTPVPGWILYAIASDSNVRSVITDLTISDDYIYIVGRYNINISFYNVVGTQIDNSPALTFANVLHNNGVGFLAKYDISGTFIWATNIHGSLSNTVVNSITIDNVGNLVLCGECPAGCAFYSANNVTPSQPSMPEIPLLLDPVPLTTIGYVVKYDNNGQVLKVAFYYSELSNSFAREVIIDESNNIYVIGTVGSGEAGTSSVNIYDGVINIPFPTPPGDIVLTTNNSSSLLIKYNSNLVISWIATVSDNGSSGSCITIDNTGVYISGSFQDGCIIYEGNGRNIPVSTGVTLNTFQTFATAGYLIKFGLNDGSLLYYTKCDTNDPGGATINISSIISDKNDKIYCLMTSASNLDLFNANFSNPSNPNSAMIINKLQGFNDSFIAQYNSSSGECIWGTIISGVTSDITNSITYKDGYIYAAVGFRSTSCSIYSANGLVGPGAPIINGTFPNNRNGLVIKYNDTGIVQWACGVSDSTTSSPLLTPFIYNNYLYTSGSNLNPSNLILYSGDGQSTPIVFGEVSQTAAGGIVVRFDAASGVPA